LPPTGEEATKAAVAARTTTADHKKHKPQTPNSLDGTIRYEVRGEWGRGDPI